MTRTASLKKRLASASWLQKLASAVIASVIAGVIVAVLVSAASKKHYSGPPVKIDEVIDERDGELQGETWLFADALHLSAATLAQINGPLAYERRHGVLNPNPFDRWAIANGGVDPTDSVTRVVLEGNRDRTVQLLGMRADAQCQQPLAGTIFYSPTAGANPVARMGFDLDSDNPVAMKATGGYVSSKPYFESTTISLAPGEQQVIDIITETEHHFCRYTFTLDVLEGSSSRTETLDDHGRPFAVSAVQRSEASEPPFARHRSVYVGGVATPNGLFKPVPNDYTSGPPAGSSSESGESGGPGEEGEPGA